MKVRYGVAFPDADAFMGDALAPDGSYQAAHLAAALQYVTDWSLAIDGGAHVGTWSRPLSQRFARVIACEPAPDTYACLTANLAAFGCANVTARPVALGAGPGTVALVLDGRGAELHNTGARYVRPGGAIPVETIDSWDLPTCGFLKLDVEGSEPCALRGALATLRRCRPIVLYEDKGFWKRYGERRDAVARVLTALGYRQFERVSCDAIWGPACMS